MIVLYRIDERLIHGQIAVAWCKTLSITHIVVANDAVVNSELQKAALKMGTPSNVKVAIKGIDDAAELLADPRLTDKRVMVVIKTVADALTLLKKVEGVKAVNLGNVGFLGDISDKTAYTSRYFRLSTKDIEELRQIQEIVPVEIQVVPSDPKKSLDSTLKGE